MFTLTEKEIDRILDSVERDLIGLQKSEDLSKSEDAKKDEEKAELVKKEGAELKPVGDQNGTVPSPEKGARSGAIEVPLEAPKSMVKEGEKGLAKDAMLPEQDADSDAPLMEDQPEGDLGPEMDEGMDEGMEMDEQLSDDDLMEIYHSMDSEELERHYMACRTAMQSLYADQGMEPQADLQEEPEADPMMEQPADAMKSEQEEGEVMQKNESQQDDKIEALEKKNKELENSVSKIAELLLKNLEQPERKAVTEIQGIEYVKKSEEGSVEEGQAVEMSDEDVKAACLQKSQDSKTTAEQRKMINDFYLNGEKSDALVKFLSGGNK